TDRDRLGKKISRGGAVTSSLRPQAQELRRFPLRSARQQRFAAASGFFSAAHESSAPEHLGFRLGWIVPAAHFQSRQYAHLRRSDEIRRATCEGWRLQLRFQQGLDLTSG